MPSAPPLPSVLVNTLNSHSAPINAIAFSALGGTYILSGSSDRQIHLSRTEPTNSGQSSLPIQKYASHGYPVLDIAVSGDNKLFGSVGGDRSVFLWDVQNAEGPLRRLGSNTSEGHSSRINCVSFAGQDDSVLVSGGDDRSVRLWDMKSRDTRPLMVWLEAKDGISSLVVPGNGHEVVAGSVDGRLRSYDIRMGRITVDVFPGPVTSLEASRDARLLLVGCLDGKLRVMDRELGSCLRTMPDQGQEMEYENSKLRLKSCWALNETVILTGSESDGRVRAWDVATGHSAGSVDVSSPGKVISVVRWREASQAEGRRGLWAAGGAQGVVRIYGSP